MQSQGFVQSLAVEQTSLVIGVGPRFASFRASDVSAGADTSRIVVDLFAAADQTATPGAPAPAPMAPEAPPLPLPTPGVRTIVIDPGHGGDEDGAKGARGTLEKTLTLAVARRVKSGLETRLGARVLLTRDDDRTLPLDERAAFANNNKADVFVSLHANASLRRTAAGAEVFFLSLDRADEEARRVAESEGVAMPVFGGGTREIDVILWEMAQSRHLVQSAELARVLESQLRIVGADEPAANPAGALSRAGRRQHAGRARGAGLPDQRGPGIGPGLGALSDAPGAGDHRGRGALSVDATARTWRGRRRRAAMTRGARAGRGDCRRVARGRPRLGAVRGAAAMDATGAPA